ncbi:hypothetical protein BEL05_02125 [Shewanella colwelliana]|uniref:Lipoprotein n=1 Tax=Shewanella colwelliana TaxID=23 RepID=A0A1E5IYG1_SHECO|nr:hypothetical protein [Shewanella colwelliana]OEG75569.1 hypothetical protein BEL05_02125 [Shewanella colwelliana]
MKLLVFFALGLIFGCSSVTNSIQNRIASDVMTDISDSKVGYGTLQCNKVRSSCRGEEEYTEWEQGDGTLGCSCSP